MRLKYRRLGGVRRLFRELAPFIDGSANSYNTVQELARAHDNLQFRVDVLWKVLGALDVIPRHVDGKPLDPDLYGMEWDDETGEWRDPADDELAYEIDLLGMELLRHKDVPDVFPREWTA